MSYDVKCYELAGAFLTDEPSVNTQENQRKLAQVIQDAIELELAEQLYVARLAKKGAQ